MLGLKEKIKRRKYDHFSESEKRMIIEDYLHSGLTKKAIWHKYTGQGADHGLLLYWMYKYGYFPEYKEKSVTFASKITNMSTHNQQQTSLSDFETLQLKTRILELEKQLHESEMKAIAWQTMVEIAEREFNISIKKKFNTKP
jgi:transposase-like protein